MKKEEAQARGIPVHPTVHTMHRRAKWHDYARKGQYMLTIVTQGRHPLLGRLITHPKPYVVPSPLGTAILDHEIVKISQIYPNVEVWRQIIMPDHIHFLVNVKEDFPAKKSLGTVVRGFKQGCNKVYRNMFGGAGDGLFERGYHDRIIIKEMAIERWKRYILDNPRRLALKRANPNLFTVLHDRVVADLNCQLVGNIFLLDIPDKMEVIVHRSDSPADFEAKKKAWLQCSERGGVLVSAAIAPREKEVMREAMNRGYSLIFIRNNGFGEYYKPSGEAFDACAEGRLLQISPREYRYDRATITRAECLNLNALATAIADGGNRP